MTWIEPQRACALVACALLMFVTSPARADEPLWVAPEGRSDVRAHRDFDGDGVPDLYVFESVEEGSGSRVHCRVYRGGEPAGPGSVLAWFQVSSPDKYWHFLGLPGNVTGGPGQDLLLREVGAHPTALIIPDFETQPANEPVRILGMPPIHLFVAGEAERMSRQDLDGDGWDDIAFEDQFIRGGAGPDLTAQEVPLSWNADMSILAPDVNGDGVTDLVLIDPGSYRRTVYVVDGGSGADLVPDFEFDTPGDAQDIAWLDGFLGDGEPCLAVADGFWGKPDVLIYRGGSTLDGTPDLVLIDDVFRVRAMGDVGDVDGDGADDLAIQVSTLEGHSIMVFRGGAVADVYPDYWYADPSSGTPYRVESVGDWDGDGLAEILAGWKVFSLRLIDLNDDGILDFDQLEEFEDCDGNGFPDVFEILVRNSYDCDGNGRVDVCELAEDPSTDCNDNGQLDVCDVASSSYDCDGNAMVDECEIAADPALDWDENAQLDVCQLEDPFYNCNGNTFLDAFELQTSWTWIDCDGNLRFDVCDIEQGLVADANGNDRPDRCEGPLRLSVAFDPSGDTRELPIAKHVPFDVYVVLDVTGPFDAPSLGTVEFALRFDELELALFDMELPVEGSWNIETTDPFGFAIRFSTPLNFSTGPIAVLKMTGFLLDDFTDVDIRPQSIWPLPGDEDQPAVPYWRNVLLQTTTMSSFTPAWVNREFADCNTNGVDDLHEIALEWVADLNSNLVPDDCESTPAPPSVSAALSVRVVPNPFNPRAVLRFVLTREGQTILDVFDTRGQLVRRLHEGPLPTGPHSVVWDGLDGSARPVSSGVYFYRLTAPSGVTTGKMALVR